MRPSVKLWLTLVGALLAALLLVNIVSLPGWLRIFTTLPAEEQAAQELLERGRGLLLQDQPAAALLAFRAILENHHGTARLDDALFTAANICEEHFNALPDALRYYEQLLTACPGSAQCAAATARRDMLRAIIGTDPDGYARIAATLPFALQQDFTSVIGRLEEQIGQNPDQPATALARLYLAQIFARAYHDQPRALALINAARLRPVHAELESKLQLLKIELETPAR